MTVTLSNGTQLECEGVHGESIYFQGANRDCLTFQFDPAKYGLEKIDKLFTPENCASITLVTDGGEFKHDGYVIRRSLEKSTGAGSEGYAVVEPEVQQPKEHILVRMAQTTYLERGQASLDNQMSQAQLALCELYELITAAVAEVPGAPSGEELEEQDAHSGAPGEAESEAGPDGAGPDSAQEGASGNG